jgi:membrane-associated PAP2 superfamily phosphatase
MSDLITFLAGAVAAGFLLAGLFFLRFWRRTRDGLFLAFAAAFFLLGFGQALLALAHLPDEERSWLYLIRLAAFALILAAIVRKNRRPA